MQQEAAICMFARQPVVEPTGSLWPPKLNLAGVPVSCTDYAGAVTCIMRAAQQGRPALITAFAAHGVVTASEDPEFHARIKGFDLVTPDGQAVRLALNFLHGAGLRDRVSGPDLTLLICQHAAELGIAIYLYGSTADTVRKLRAALIKSYPKIQIVGCEPSVFRPLTPEEDVRLVERIRGSGARIVFIGLGCSLQERFAHEHRHSIPAVQVCVGAAFDFIAGTKRRAPRWMQDHALEWLFRLIQEPRRLLKRNVVYSPKFVAKVALQVRGGRHQERSFQG